MDDLHLYPGATYGQVVPECSFLPLVANSSSSSFPLAKPGAPGNKVKLLLQRVNFLSWAS